MRQMEVESCKMEIESQNVEKTHLESRVLEVIYLKIDFLILLKILRFSALDPIYIHIMLFLRWMFMFLSAFGLCL